MSINKIVEQWIGEEEKNNIITQDEPCCASEYRQALTDLKSRIPELESMIIWEIEKMYEEDNWRKLALKMKASDALGIASNNDYYNQGINKVINSLKGGNDK